MLTTAIEDIFGNRYIVKQRHQITPSNQCVTPVSFSSILQATQFVKRLKTPVDFWKKLSVEPNNRRKANASPAYENIAQQLVRGNYLVFELGNKELASQGYAAAAVEQPNGDRYTFAPASALLTAPAANTLETTSEKEAADALEKLGASDEQLEAIAKSLSITPANPSEGNLKATIVAALVAGQIVVIEQKKLSAPPKLPAESSVDSKDKPVELAPEAEAAPVQQEANEKSTIDEPSQADTLRSASENAAALCEECESSEAA